MGLVTEQIVSSDSDFDSMMNLSTKPSKVIRSCHSFSETDSSMIDSDSSSPSYQSSNQSINQSPSITPIDTDEEPVFQYSYYSPFNQATSQTIEQTVEQSIDPSVEASIAAWTRRSSVETEKEGKKQTRINYSHHQPNTIDTTSIHQVTSPFNSNQTINYQSIYQSLSKSITRSIQRVSRHTSVPSISCEARCDWAASYSFDQPNNQTIKSPINMETFNLTTNQSEQTSEPDHSSLIARLSSSLTLVHEAEVDDECGIITSCDETFIETTTIQTSSPKNLNKFGLKLAFTQPDSPTNDSIEQSIEIESNDQSNDQSNMFSMSQPIKPPNSGRRAIKRGSFDISENGTLIAGAFQIGQSGVRKSVSSNNQTNNQSNDQGNSEQTSNQVGNQINSCDLIRVGELGAGATGTVLKCLHLATLQLVAVKNLSIYDQSQRHMMIKELHGFSLSNHPNLLHFHGASLDDLTGQCSLVLELIDRGSLESMIEKHGPCTNEEQLSFLCRQIFEGLKHLASLKCIHRDIKPGNFLLQSNGCVKISDFGLLRQLDRTKDLAQTFLGTMSFLAPERITGDSYSCLSDIWSAGMSILAMMKGPDPQQSNDYWSILSLVNAEAPRVTVDEGWSIEMCDFIDKCLQKDPELRWSAAQLLEHPFLTKSNKQTSNSSLLDGSLAGSWPISNVKSSSADELNVISRALLDHSHPCTKQLDVMIQSIDQSNNQSIEQIKQFHCLCQQLRCTPMELKQAIELELQYRDANSSIDPIKQSNNQSNNEKPKRASMTSSGNVNALSMSQQIKAMMAASMKDSLSKTVDLYED